MAGAGCVDESEGNIMAPAHETLRAMGCPIVCTPGPALRWTLDLNGRATILVGYGTKDPQQRSMHHFIIKYYVGKGGVPCFGMVEPQNTYPSKHTRVSVNNIKVFDPNLPVFSDVEKKVAGRKLGRFLGEYYEAHVEDAFAGLEKAKKSMVPVAIDQTMNDDESVDNDNNEDDIAAEDLDIGGTDLDNEEDLFASAEPAPDKALSSVDKKPSRAVPEPQTASTCDEVVLMPQTPTAICHVKAEHRAMLKMIKRRQAAKEIAATSTSTSISAKNGSRFTPY
ncbi:hypothetical protein MBLNU459_g0483t1 [Dothideomycetes sp. NU459]